MIETPRVLLVRHGQSEWNRAKRWQGRSDSPLTALGRNQAERCGSLLAGHAIGFGSLWSSSLGRTLETAAILSDALDLRPVRADDRLQEADAGEWSGLHISEIEQQYPGWLDSGRRPDTFEPTTAVVDRTVAALRAIVGNGDGRPALAVTHSGVVRRLVERLGGVDRRVPNLGGAWLRIDASTTRATSPVDGVVLDALFDGPAEVPIGWVDAAVDRDDAGDDPDDADGDGSTQR